MKMYEDKYKEGISSIDIKGKLSKGLAFVVHHFMKVVEEIALEAKKLGNIISSSEKKEIFNIFLKKFLEDLQKDILHDNLKELVLDIPIQIVIDICQSIVEVICKETKNKTINFS